MPLEERQLSPQQRLDLEDLTQHQGWGLYQSLLEELRADQARKLETIATVDQTLGWNQYCSTRACLDFLTSRVIPLVPFVLAEPKEEKHE